MQSITKKSLKSSLLIILVGCSYGSLSISDYQPEKMVLSEAKNGNEIATISNMPLDVYLQSIYSGYTVKFDQMGNEKVTINSSDKIPNNAADILSFLAESYQLSFSLDNQEHIITVSPSNNVSYQSYKQGLKTLNTERDELSRDYAQKTKDYDNVSEQNSALYQHAQALSHSGDALKAELQSLLQKGSFAPKESVKIKSMLEQWQLTQKGAPYRLDDQMSIPLIQPVKKVEEEKEVKKERVIDNAFVVSPFIAESDKKHITDIYNKNKKLVEDEKIKDSEFMNAFIAELNDKDLHVYHNEKTKKTAIATTENNAQLLTNDKTFYAFKDESVQAVLDRWATAENIKFDLSDTPEQLLKVTMPDNEIFKGVVLSKDSDDNAVGELIKQAIVLLKKHQQ